MSVESHYLSFRSTIIHYTRCGQGSDWLFCFHGYGEDAASFSIFHKLLADQYTLIAIDLPFHGKTDWQEGLLLEPADLIFIINQIKTASQPISLIGYSMGGRVALQLLQLIPEQITQLLLVAPDGLHKNKWQWFSTRTFIGKRLFAYAIKNPEWLLTIVDLAGKMSLYDKNLLKFIHYYLDEEGQREILFRRWTTMRKFRPVKDLLKKNIQAYQISVNLLFGKYDKVILTKHGRAFNNHLEKYIKVIEIDAGHQLMKEKYALIMASLLMPIKG